MKLENLNSIITKDISTKTIENTSNISSRGKSPHVSPLMTKNASGPPLCIRSLK